MLVLQIGTMSEYTHNNALFYSGTHLNGFAHVDAQHVVWTHGYEDRCAEANEEYIDRAFTDNSATERWDAYEGVEDSWVGIVWQQERRQGADDDVDDEDRQRAEDGGSHGSGHFQKQSPFKCFSLPSL